MELDLHDIHPDSIELALDKARQYRSLHEPEIAESICLDILHIEPENQKALVLYILALSDQLHHAGKKTQVQSIEQAIQKLQSRYQQYYYTGLLHERRARFMLTQSMARVLPMTILSKHCSSIRKRKSVQSTMTSRYFAGTAVSELSKKKS